MKGLGETFCSFKIAFFIGLINLDSDVIKDWKKNLRKDFKPKLFAKVLMMLLKSHL